MKYSLSGRVAYTAEAVKFVPCYLKTTRKCNFRGKASSRPLCLCKFQREDKKNDNKKATMGRV